MNSKELIDCFDAITPTKEQKDKMLSAILEKKNIPVKVYKFHRFAAAAAAVIVIGIFAIVYPNIKDDVTVQESDNADVAYRQSTESKEPVSAGSDETRAVKPDVSVQSGKSEISSVKTDDNQSAVSAEDSSMSAMVSEEYTDDTNDTDNTNELKLADAFAGTGGYERSIDVYDDFADNDESVKCEEVPGEESLDMAVSSAAGYAGGGGLDLDASSGAPAVAGTYNMYTYMSLSDIMCDSVYSKLFPTEITDGFVFSSAGVYSGTLEAYFYAGSRYMSVSIVKGEEYNFTESVVVPDSIKEMKAKDGYLNFAVKCGQYYVVYNIETENVTDVYKMVTSSEYFDS